MNSTEPDAIPTNAQNTLHPHDGVSHSEIVSPMTAKKVSRIVRTRSLRMFLLLSWSVMASPICFPAR
jgi:hypothetical protein